ncbi:MAG TPA: DUF255 domain-containing protein [Gemmatimonadales bacterium]|jgi:uncharacterized protein YyaL (SSP411 family)|nr:DUF255 domain-containing protein [Gemmatimonadales bacterium]
MRTRPILVVLLAACVAERGPFTNRMAHSATSYLARAARQPVDWQPWGRDAFALAAKLDRPVLLYVGSEACRWCAETDRAIYTDPEIGALINALFVPVRVDRDERPDVAQRYQAAVETMAGLHGWPLTVFLTADGAPFFGGTYFPADDPVTGRGLKQILPEVAKGYRDRRSFIVQHAALVRQLALAGGAGGAGGGGPGRGGGVAHGVLQPGRVRGELVATRAALDAAVRSHAAVASVMHAEAASLLLSEYARGDTAALAVARRALDLMIDSAAVATGPPAGAREDPPRLVRAALLRGLAKGWVVTGEPRYRDAGRSLARSLAREVADPGDRVLFADQEAYVIEAVVLAAATLGDAVAEGRGRVALDGLLQRMYARGWGVRHAVAGATQGLLQDQVQVAGACIAAYQVGGDARYLEVARDLAAVLERNYADPLGGYYDAATVDPAAPAFADRTKQVFDDILPGANAWTARVLLRLSEATGDAAYRRRAEAALEAFIGAVDGAGVRASTFLGAAREVLASRAP